MSARYYLNKRAGGGREKRLRLIVYRGGRQVPVMTPVTVRAADWSQKMQRVKASVPGATELNAQLQRLRNEADALALAHPDDDSLREALLERLGRAPQEPELTLLEHFDEFLAYRRSRVKENTVRVLATLREHLTMFTDRKNLKVIDVGSGFVEDFQTHLLEQGLNNNSANKYTSRLQSFLWWLHERGEIESAPRAKPLKTAQSHVIRLTLDELAALQSVDLSGESPSHDAARDLFLLCCFTGQRIGDVRNMEWKDIQGDAWYLREEKTGVVRRVPLAAPALEIIGNYRDEQRPVPRLSVQKANVYIKVVAERAGITALVTVRSQKGGKLETRTFPKCKTLTMHVGRRTFVSLMMESGISAKEMLGITHNDLRSLRHYAGASEDHIRRALQKVFGTVQVTRG